MQVAIYLTGEIAQVKESIPGSVVPLAMFVLCTAYLRPEIYVCGDMFVLSRFMVETWRISLPGVGARDATPSHKKG